MRGKNQRGRADITKRPRVMRRSIGQETGKLDISKAILPLLGMSKVEQVESELRKLSAAELRQVRDWLEDFVEDQLEFTPEFEAAIQESKAEMKSGTRPRVRRTES